MNEWRDKPQDPTQEVREYLCGKLPKSYTRSHLFALHIREEEGVRAAEITLDMLADGSGYTGFGEDDFMMLAELEAEYLLGTVLKRLPAPTDILLRMLFSGEEILVERRWGETRGTLTYGAARMDIDFEE